MAEHDVGNGSASQPIQCNNSTIYHNNGLPLWEYDLLATDPDAAFLQSLVYILCNKWKTLSIKRILCV